MDSLTCSGTSRRRPRAVAASTMAVAITWCDACSSEAPSIKTCSAVSPGATSTESNRAPPTVSVPVLSNSTVCARASASSAPPPLTRIPRRARSRHARDEGDRRRQDQRTRRRRHQHRKAAQRVARDQPRNQRQRQRHRQEDQRIAVGQPHEWRLRGLRRGHQFHDAGIGAFAGRRRYRHFKGFAGVQRAGEDGCAPGSGHRDRFARQCELVDHGCVRVDDAVDRNDFAGMDQQRSPTATCRPAHPRCGHRRDDGPRAARDRRARADHARRGQPRYPPARCRRNTSAPPRRRPAAGRARAQHSSTPARSHRRRTGPPASP